MSGDDRAEAAGAAARAAGRATGARGAGTAGREGVADAAAGALSALSAADEARRAWRTAGAVEMGQLTEVVRGADDVLGSPVSAPGTAGGWTRKAGLAGAAIGVVAAGVALERLTVHRAVRRKARLALDSSGPYGSLRGTSGTAYAEDGTALYFEVDEPADFAGQTTGAAASGDGAGGPEVAPAHLDDRTDETGGTGETGEADGLGSDEGGDEGADGSVPEGYRDRLLRLLRRTPSTGEDDESGSESGAGEPPPLTVVFSHGYCLNQDVWHFQRAALRGAVRTVYWDQRSHGRSGRAPAGEPVSIDLLGHDLKAVLDAAVPEGPDRAGGALDGRYDGDGAGRPVPGVRGGAGRGVALPRHQRGRARRGDATGCRPPGCGPCGGGAGGAQGAGLADRAGRAGTAGDGGPVRRGSSRRYSFGSAGEVDPGVARFAERLIESVPIDVVAEFYPAFAEHEKTAALSAFDELPALVLAGDRDLLTPSEHSETIAARAAGRGCVILEATGHLLMLERPETVNEQLAALLARTIRAHGSTGTQPAHRVPVRPAIRRPRVPGSRVPGSQDRSPAGASGGAQRRGVTVTVQTGDDMRELGRRLAGLLRPGDLVLLTGELGAGKTTLTRGLGEGLGVRGAVTSPTFVIARVHPSLSDGPALVHVDAYRLGGGLEEMEDLDLDVSLPESVVVVEWGEGRVEELSEDRLHVVIARSVGRRTIFRGGAVGAGAPGGPTTYGP